MDYFASAQHFGKSFKLFVASVNLADKQHGPFVMCYGLQRPFHQECIAKDCFLFVANTRCYVPIILNAVIAVDSSIHTKRSGIEAFITL